MDLRVLTEAYVYEPLRAFKLRWFGFCGLTIRQILFFEDGATIKSMQERTPAYAGMFPEWSEHATGMHQYAFWTALEAIPGMGCNLQHYNFDPEITELTKSTWNLPQEWSLRAQLVFGEAAPDAYPKEPKEKLPISETLKVFGSQ